MAGLAINEVLSKTFFSMQESKIPMINSILSMIVNVVLAYILFNFMQANGLALATACGSICNAILNAISMKRKYPGMMNKRDFVTIFKSLASTVVMAAVVWLLYSFIGGRLDGLVGNIILIAVCGIAGVIVYGLMLLITGVDDIKNILKKKG
jgi:putative peptidoglycan lipid II flippase